MVFGGIRPWNKKSSAEKEEDLNLKRAHHLHFEENNDGIANTCISDACISDTFRSCVSEWMLKS